MVKNNEKKVKKIKSVKVKTEEQEEISRFVKILIVVIVFIVGIYAFTQTVVKKDSTSKSEDKTSGTISYSKIILGSLLNQAYDEYYVFAYNGNSTNAIYYSVIIDKYVNTTDSKKVYWADLDNELNKKFIAKDDETSNPKAKKISELKLGEYTLIKIKGKKIVAYYDTIEDAKKELKLNS